MLDWNLDGNTLVEATKTKTSVRFHPQTITKKPRFIRKSKTFVDNTQQFLTHSGRNQRNTPHIRIKKAKRDEFGDVVRGKI